MSIYKYRKLVRLMSILQFFTIAVLMALVSIYILKDNLGKYDVIVSFASSIAIVSVVLGITEKIESECFTSAAKTIQQVVRGK